MPEEQLYHMMDWKEFQEFMIHCDYRTGDDNLPEDIDYCENMHSENKYCGYYECPFNR